MKRAIGHHPRLAAAALVVLCSLANCLLAGWSGLSLQFGLAHHAAMAALAALVLTVTGWWSEVGFTRPTRWRNLHLAVIPLLAVSALFPSVAEVGGARLLPYATLALLIALQREIWFRGILFRTLVPAYGPRRTVALTALLFGFSQGVDILAGAAPGVTVVKALVSALFGYVLGALRLRTRTIWPGVAVVTIFYLSMFADRLRDSGEMLPISSERLTLQAFLSLVVFLCARRWMRKADEHQAPETARAS